jgi:hypothetical protein
MLAFIKIGLFVFIGLQFENVNISSKPKGHVKNRDQIRGGLVKDTK